MFATSLNTVLDRMLTLSQAMDEASRGNDLAESRSRIQLWVPAVDLYETENAFVIAADLPGVHEENVDLQYDRGTLTISGTRGATLPAAEKTQLRVFNAERMAGAFSRSVRLPDHIEAERISASFAAGVLTVQVPKSPSALPRKISIRGNVEQNKLNA
jgi:HSP20 family protein